MVGIRKIIMWLLPILGSSHFFLVIIYSLHGRELFSLIYAKKLSKYNNPRRHIFVQARLYCYRQFRPLKGRWCKNGVNQRVVIQKAIAALSKSNLCSYTAMADKQDFYHISILLIKLGYTQLC